MRKKQLGSVKITKDVWFYVNPKSFDFVVWANVGDKRGVVQFRLRHKKIKKYL